MTSDEFQRHAEKLFPLVPHLGLTVKKLDETECILAGELAPNKNHLGTAFGGSLYCFGALACYALVWSELEKHNISTQDIVISEGQIKYISAVDQDFEVLCQVPGEMQKFISMIKSKKKARLQMRAEIRTSKGVCASFQGLYVAKI